MAEIAYFADNILGVELLDYQKKILRGMSEINKNTKSEEQIMVKTFYRRKYHAPVKKWRPHRFGFKPKLILIDDFHDQTNSEARQSTTTSASAPLLRKTMEDHEDGKTLTVYKDDIEKELYKHLGIGLMQLGG